MIHSTFKFTFAFITLSPLIVFKKIEILVSTYQGLLEVAKVLVGHPEAPIRLVLVPQTPALQGQTQKLLVILGTLVVVTERVETIAEAAECPGFLLGDGGAARGGLRQPRIEALELLFKVGNGLLKVEQVHARKAHVAVRLRLCRAVFQLL